MLSLKIKSSFKSYDRFIWHFEDLHKTAVSDLVRNTSCGHWVNITGAGVAVFHTHVGLLAILAPLLQKIKTEPNSGGLFHRNVHFWKGKMSGHCLPFQHLNLDHIVPYL